MRFPRNGDLDEAFLVSEKLHVTCPLPFVYFFLFDMFMLLCIISIYSRPCSQLSLLLLILLKSNFVASEMFWDAN